MSPTIATTSTTRPWNTDLFKDAGPVDSVTDVVDQFEETEAERFQSSIFNKWWIMKIKVNEDRLC